MHFIFYGLFTVFTFTQVAAAKPSCATYWLLEPYSVCQAPEHGVQYKEAASAACPVRRYKSCDIPVEVTAIARTGDVFRYPGKDYVDYPSESFVKTKCEEFLLATHGNVPESFIAAAEEFFKAHNDVNNLDMPSMISRFEAGEHSPPELVQHSFHMDPKEMWSYKYSCHYKMTFTTTYQGVNESCGVEDYEICRDESHGEDGFIAKRSKVCPLEENTHSLVTPSEKKELEKREQDFGKYTCVTFDSIPESTLEEKSRKLGELLNMDKILNGTGLNYSPFIELPSDESQWTAKQIQTAHTITWAGWYLARFAILLETTRLNLVINPKYPEFENDLKKIDESLFEVSKYVPRAGFELGNNSNWSLDDIIRWLVKNENFTGLESFARAENDFRNVRDYHSTRWSSLDTYLYVGLFPDATLRPPEDLPDIMSQMTESTDSTVVYRLAETAIAMNFNRQDKSELWKIADLAEIRSKDGRLPLLKAYRAIAEGRFNDYENFVAEAINNQHHAPSRQELEMSLRSIQNLRATR